MKKAQLILFLILFIFLMAFGFYYYFYLAPLQIPNQIPGDQKEATVTTAGDDYNKANIDGAISKTETIVAKDQSNINALLLLATSYAEKGSVAFDETTYGQKAIDTANKVLALDPKNSEAYRIIGYANEIMQKYDIARANYDKAIALDPKNAQAYSNKGHSYDLQGDLKNAAIWYDKALSIDPNNEHALSNKARILIRASKLKEALAVLDILENTSKNSRFLAGAYQLTATILTYQDHPDYALALKAINQSLAYDNTLPQAWVSKGFIGLRTLLKATSESDFKSRLDDIENDANKALALNPNQATAYKLLSLTASARGDVSTESAMKKKALEAIPNDITLGEKEKSELKKDLSIIITVIKK